jgi:hypothetical protein
MYISMFYVCKYIYIYMCVCVCLCTKIDIYTDVCVCVCVPFRRVRKIAKSDYYLNHVCPSVHPMEQLGSHWTDFREIEDFL